MEVIKMTKGRSFTVALVVPSIGLRFGTIAILFRHYLHVKLRWMSQYYVTRIHVNHITHHFLTVVLSNRYKNCIPHAHLRAILNPSECIRLGVLLCFVNIKFALLSLSMIKS